MVMAGEPNGEVAGEAVGRLHDERFEHGRETGPRGRRGADRRAKLNASMIAHSDLAALDRLKTRIQGLRFKTMFTATALPSNIPTVFMKFGGKLTGQYFTETVGGAAVILEWLAEAGPDVFPKIRFSVTKH
jgi:hypothetical protein